MKKLLFALSVLSVLAFTSCKKTANAVGDAANATTEAVGDAANTATDAVGDAANATTDAVSDATGAVTSLFGADFQMPTFENAEVTTWANNLVTAAAGVKTAAADSPDALKTATDKFNEVSGQLKNFAGSPDFAKATEFFKEVTAKVAAQ